MRLANRWSLDPTTLDSVAAEPGLGHVALVPGGVALGARAQDRLTSWENCPVNSPGNAPASIAGSLDDRKTFALAVGLEPQGEPVCGHGCMTVLFVLRSRMSAVHLAGSTR